MEGMHSLMKRALTMLAVMILAAGCGSLQRGKMPASGYLYGDLLLDEAFDSARGWRTYDGGGELWLGVQDSAFRIDLRGKRYAWTQHDQRLRDTIIEVETRQLSEYAHNAYGVACRMAMDNSGRGYFFLISGDGHASIRWSDGRSLRAIVAAFPSQHIKQGQARNRVRAVCVGDYLALWVNDEFVAEARDRRASSGAVGLAGVMSYAGKRLSAAYDNLRVWSASVDSGR